MNISLKLALAAASCVALAAPVRAQGSAQAPAKHDSVKMDARAKPARHDTAAFGPDAQYPDIKYDYQAQLDIYGAKHMNPTQRPLLELGRDLYAEGPFRKGINILGKHNLFIPQLLVYGDFRTAGGQSSVGGSAPDVGTWANRLNLDVDLKLTATERIHALFRPFENADGFTRFDFTGTATGFKQEFDAKPSALFFEGDLGAIVGGITGRDSPFDMPIAVGLMPLVFHNGAWIEDAFTGAAFTIPARNSGSLDWSNFDITFFAGMDRLSNPAFRIAKDTGMIGGVNVFVEANKGYWEAGYAMVKSDSGRAFHSAALSFTRRYGGWLSNSVRYIGAFNMSTNETLSATTEADGHIILIENSLITSKPSTVVPYLNLFAGMGTPASALRDPGSGGILKNTGLNFETDALTAFPSLDASARDAVGGALGLNVLGSNLNRQFVIEVAASYPHKTSLLMPGGQYGAGFRAQQNLTKAMLLRVDGMFGKREGLTNVRGARLELRYKF